MWWVRIFRHSNVILFRQLVANKSSLGLFNAHLKIYQWKFKTKHVAVLKLWDPQVTMGFGTNSWSTGTKMVCIKWSKNVHSWLGWCGSIPILWSFHVFPMISNDFVSLIAARTWFLEVRFTIVPGAPYPISLRPRISKRPTLFGQPHHKPTSNSPTGHA